MIFYLTYNDGPSGIFSSQVIDTVKFLKNEFREQVRLVAFISLRNYSDNKEKIKREYPDAIVCPMFPGVQRWRYNRFLLGMLVGFYKPKVIIGRSVLATQLALKLKSKKRIERVIYDGRGAIAAEWKEYGVINHPGMLAEIDGLEKDAVLKSDFRIAVSGALVNFWRTEYDYHDQNVVVIPCTLNKVFEEVSVSKERIVQLRAAIGFNNNDSVYVYSGSIAGWQSFDLLYNFIKPVLRASAGNKLLFLCDRDEHIIKLQEEFKGQVSCKKVNSHEVPDYLLAADYGLLLRENTITNKVASPVKFAEYLACGLEVIISDDLGDYSQFVADNHCGHLFTNFVQAHQIPMKKKTANRELAMRHFTKKEYVKEYRQLFYSSKNAEHV